MLPAELELTVSYEERQFSAARQTLNDQAPGSADTAKLTARVTARTEARRRAIADLNAARADASQ